MTRTDGRGPKRPWQPMARASLIQHTPEKREKLLAWYMELTGGSRDEAELFLYEEQAREAWKNHLYTVIVERDGDRITTLSIRRNDRRPEPFPWRHLQMIKNEVAGPEIEALELFPAQSRLVDTANQRWLWCLPPGEQVPVGFTVGHIGNSEIAAEIGARQTDPDYPEYAP